MSEQRLSFRQWRSLSPPKGLFAWWFGLPMQREQRGSPRLRRDNSKDAARLDALLRGEV
jgi:hypothetical protein